VKDFLIMDEKMRLNDTIGWVDKAPQVGRKRKHLKKFFQLISKNRC
jgi:hypothetical protein